MHQSLRLGIEIAKRYIGGETIKSINEDFGLRQGVFDRAVFDIWATAKLPYYKRFWRNNEVVLENITAVERIIDEIQEFIGKIESKKIELRNSINDLDDH